MRRTPRQGRRLCCGQRRGGVPVRGCAGAQPLFPGCSEVRGGGVGFAALSCGRACDVEGAVCIRSIFHTPSHILVVGSRRGFRRSGRAAQGGIGVGIFAIHAVDNGLRIGGDVAGRIAAIEVDGALCIFEDAGQAQGGMGKRFGIGQRDAPVFKLLLCAGKLFFQAVVFPYGFVEQLQQLQAVKLA